MGRMTVLEKDMLLLCKGRSSEAYTREGTLQQLIKTAMTLGEPPDKNILLLRLVNELNL